MPINFPGFRQTVGNIANLNVDRSSGKGNTIKRLAGLALKGVRQATSSKAATNIKASNTKQNKSLWVINELYSEAVGGKENPTLTPSVKTVDELMELLSDKTLSEDDKSQIREQMDEGVSYINENRKELSDKARSENRPIYIRPDEYGGGKIGDKEGLEASYKGCHIQVNPDGKIYLIPKHPNLTLGKGTFKKVRMAIELDENARPKRVVAFASVRPLGTEGFESAKKEVETIKKLVSREQGENEPVDVRIEVYESEELGKGAKAKVVLPYSNMGDLSDQNFTHADKPHVMKGCVKWIKLMHENGLANFDIKRENFLGFRDADNQIAVKGLDLDMARSLDEGPMVRPPGGTSEYMAPEVIAAIIPNLKATKKEDLVLCDGRKADIFSLGKTLYFLDIGSMNRRLDFISRDPATKEITYDPEQYKRSWNDFEALNPVQVLAKAMMHPEPELRPDIETVDELLTQIFDKDPPISLDKLEYVLRRSLQDVDVVEKEAPDVKPLSAEEEQLKTLLDNPHIDPPEGLLEEKGAWLIRKEEGKLYLDYFTDNKETMELLDNSPASVLELLDYLPIEKSKFVSK